MILLFFGFSTSFAQITTPQLLTKEEFFTQLSHMGIDTSLLTSKDKLSRYELTRLLNAVECQDCILPHRHMRENYSSAFWSEFVQLPGKDFRDILFESAYHHQTNYYYCVASVGAKNYMKGYPLATSPICGGNFCGTRTITKAEFYQTLVNLLAPNIAPKYQIHRGDIRNWLNKVGRSSYEYKTFDNREIEKIQKA
ncbi:MAG: hypothetical protein Q4B28_06085 [bacterium]|nr:hypothetical protein [bacterium]